MGFQLSTNSCLVTFCYRSQNQLPTWIAQSTISGEASTASLQSSSHLTALSLSSNNNNRKQSLSQSASTALAKSTLDADLDNYYANLAVEAAKIELPPSNIGSPILLSVKEEEGESEFDFEEREREREVEITKVMKSMPQTTIEEFNGGNGSGKRSRDEVDSGLEEAEAGGRNQDEELDGGGKRMRIGTGSISGGGTPSEINLEINERKEETLEGTVDEGTPVEGVIDDEEEEEYEDEFELEEGGDPNPLISIGDKMVPFLEVGEELQTAMVST